MTYHDLEAASEFDPSDIRATTYDDGDAEYQANLPSQEEMDFWTWLETASPDEVRAFNDLDFIPF